MSDAQFLKARVSSEMKERVHALAEQQLITESVWLKRLVAAAVHESVADDSVESRAVRAAGATRRNGVLETLREDAPCMRVCIRLRPEDRVLLRVCTEFVSLCRRLQLFSESLVAIDSSKFKGKVRGRIEQLKESIGRYLEEMDRADRQPTLVSEERVVHITKKIETIRTHIQRLNEIKSKLSQLPDGQLCLTDPDARCMAKRGRQTPTVAYNVQTAVDVKHHLIVAYEVTNVGNIELLSRLVVVP